MKLQKSAKSLFAGTLLAMAAISAHALELKATQIKPKPDLVVYYIYANYDNDPHTVRAVIRNNGSDKSVQAMLRVKNLSGGTKNGIVPPLAPNHTVEVEIAFRKAMEKGDRLEFFVDSQDYVDESNENNNVKGFTY